MNTQIVVIRSNTFRKYACTCFFFNDTPSIRTKIRRSAKFDEIGTETRAFLTAGNFGMPLALGMTPDARSWPPALRCDAPGTWVFGDQVEVPVVRCMLRSKQNVRPRL